FAHSASDIPPTASSMTADSDRRHADMKNRACLDSAAANKHVPSSTDCLQELRVLRVLLDLSTNPHNPQIDTSIECFGAAGVGKIHELLSAEHSVWVLCEYSQ